MKKPIKTLIFLLVLLACSEKPQTCSNKATNPPERNKCKAGKIFIAKQCAVHGIGTEMAVPLNE